MGGVFWNVLAWVASFRHVLKRLKQEASLCFTRFRAWLPIGVAAMKHTTKTSFIKRTHVVELFMHLSEMLGSTVYLQESKVVALPSR